MYQGPMTTWKITLTGGRVRLIRATSETWAWNKANLYWPGRVAVVYGI